MKYIYIFLVFFLFGACSPESMINRKLDGEWSLISINSENLPPNYSKSIQFSKDRKGGTLVYTIVINDTTVVKNGIYAIIKSGSMSFAFPNSAFGSGYETQSFELTKSTKSDLILTEIGNGYGVYTFKKK